MVFDSASTERENRIREVDARIPSPSQRADQVWQALKQALPDATNWDVLCFCVEFQGLVSQEYLWLEEPAKQAARLVYAAHYLNPEKIDAATGIEPRNQHSRSLRSGEPESRGVGPDGPRSLFDGRNQDRPIRLHLRDDEVAAREVEGKTGSREDVREGRSNSNER